MVALRGIGILLPTDSGLSSCLKPLQLLSASTGPRFVCDFSVSDGPSLTIEHDKVLVVLIYSVYTLLRPVIAGGPRRVCRQCPLNAIPFQRTVWTVSAAGREKGRLRLGLFSIYPNAVVSRLMRASDASGPPAEQIAASKYLGELQWIATAVTLGC